MRNTGLHSDLLLENADTGLSISGGSTEFESVRSARNSISPSNGSRQLDTELVQMEDDGVTTSLAAVTSSYLDLTNVTSEEPGQSNNRLDTEVVQIEDDFDSMHLAPVISSFNDLESLSSVVPDPRQDGDDTTSDHNFSDNQDMLHEADARDGYTTGVTDGGQYYHFIRCSMLYVYISSNFHMGINTKTLLNIFTPSSYQDLFSGALSLGLGDPP